MVVVVGVVAVDVESAATVKTAEGTLAHNDDILSVKVALKKMQFKSPVK